MPEIENGTEPAISLGNEEVAAVKAWLTVRLGNCLYGSFSKQCVPFGPESMSIAVLYQSLSNTSKARWPVSKQE